jgi:ABC-type phosphate/phosphonate transport system substrate-binding protein
MWFVRLLSRHFPPARTLISLVATLLFSVLVRSLPTDGGAYLLAMQWDPATALSPAWPRPFVFTVSPDETDAHTHESYAAIAAYLSRVTGKQVVYQPTADWTTYQRATEAGTYDLAFSSAQLASWLIARRQYAPLLRVSSEQRFIVVTRAAEKDIPALADLAGRRVCAPPLPNPGTLSLYSYFDNPARRPLFVSTSTAGEIYGEMTAGGCDAGVVSLRDYEAFAVRAKDERVLLRTPTMPGPTLTAGPRLSSADRTAITEALLAPEGQQLMRPLFRRVDASSLVRASLPEYAGLRGLLSQLWGFDS